MTNTEIKAEERRCPECANICYEWEYTCGQCKWFQAKYEWCRYNDAATLRDAEACYEHFKFA